MDTAPLVVRVVFIDAWVDHVVAVRSVREEVRRSEILREFLQAGMVPFMTQRVSLTELALEPGREMDEREGSGKVIRTIYLDPAFDEYLRTTAFELRCGISALARSFISRGYCAHPKSFSVEQTRLPSYFAKLLNSRQ